MKAGGLGATMRRLAALLGLLLLPGALAAAGDAAERCGVTVCAQARSTLSVDCEQGAEAGDAVLRCTLGFVSFTWGRSPLLLPGRVFLGGDAQATWSCTAGCEAGRVERNVNAYATWLGGPFDVAGQGLGPGDGGDVPVLTHLLELRVPAETPACLRYHAELETTALAETPHAPRPLPGGWLEEVYAGDGAVEDATVCLG